MELIRLLTDSLDLLCEVASRASWILPDRG
ncbi:hypothetical protein MHAS44199_18855 [Mycolicibacterium hassiacum DSM 44199]|nr:hypothetical protein [Mycolicibacterium hassiacum DSM 44199]